MWRELLGMMRLALESGDGGVSRFLLRRAGATGAEMTSRPLGLG